MISPWFLLAFALLRTSAPQDEPLDFSCATFHASLSESDLIARFGRENVTNGPVTGADDGPIEGTILFADRADTRVEVMWRDVAARRHPLSIRVRGERSRWRTPNGLAIGDDLLTIEQRNGWPFRLAGFTSELHGKLRNWGEGRLGNTPNCDISINFQPRDSARENPVLLRQVTSLSNVSSGHPAMQELNPRVVELWIRPPVPQSPANP